VPLKLCVAASNEWPSPDTGQELSALFDRFALRKSVTPIRSRLGRQKLLWTADHVPKLSSTIAPGELAEARTAAGTLPWSSEAKEALEGILNELAKEGIRPGDRRQFKTVGVVRAFAFLAGAERVEPEHLEVAQHCLWDHPQEQPQKVTQVIARIANPTGMRVTQFLLEVESVLSATDVRNLAEAAKAAAKLGEIDRQLASLSGNGRLEKARVYLKEQLKKLKLASIEAV
jgi:MoxR-like ATPase